MVIYPNNRRENKDNYNKQIVAAQPIWLYVGRLDSEDQNLVMIMTGQVANSHTVRETSMPLAQQLTIINQNDVAVAEQKYNKKLYQACGIIMNSDDRRFLADRALGGTSKWDKKSSLVKDHFALRLLPPSQHPRLFGGVPPPSIPPYKANERDLTCLHQSKNMIPEQFPVPPENVDVDKFYAVTVLTGQLVMGYLTISDYSL